MVRKQQAGGSSASLLQREATGGEGDTLGSTSVLPERESRAVHAWGRRENAGSACLGKAGKSRPTPWIPRVEAGNQDTPGDNAGNYLSHHCLWEEQDLSGCPTQPPLFFLTAY